MLSRSQPRNWSTGGLSALRPIPAELDRGSPSTREVALTFDAGSNASAVPLLLKTLHDRGIRATFFLTGRFCDQFPRQARAIADAGMELGNHSYSHPHFTHLSDAAIRTELQRAEAAIVRTCGRGAKPLFRFPYGDSNARVIRVVAAAGYQPVAWTLDSLDSVGNPKSAAFVARRIDTRIRPGYITLMHVSYPASARALPSIFDRLAAIHARQVPVSQLLLASRATKPRAGNKTAGRLLRLARRPAP